jgi:hypothetical protein
MRIVLDVSYMFLIALLQIPSCLPYISLSACFTSECVNSTLVVVFSFVVVSGFGKLEYSVLVFECYFEVCMFKKDRLFS